jgi:hypothetical protein
METPTSAGADQDEGEYTACVLTGPVHTNPGGC